MNTAVKEVQVIKATITGEKTEKSEWRRIAESVPIRTINSICFSRKCAIPINTKAKSPKVIKRRF